MQFHVLVAVLLVAVFVTAESAAINKTKGNSGKGGQRELEEINRNVKSKDVEDALAAEKEIGGKKYQGISRQEINRMKKTAAKIRRAAAKNLGVPEPDAETAESILFDDIVYNEEQLEEILESLEGGQGGRKKRQFRTGSQYPNRRVPYLFESSASSLARTAINNAVARFEEKTCIDFVLDYSQSGSYVAVTSNAAGCFSYVGRQGQRSQLNLASGCESTGIAIHELMHAIGFYHEQSRSDRNAYVRIIYGNIKSGYESNFDIKTNSDRDGQGPYDFRSIMHYGAFFFQKAWGLRTIETVQSANQGLIDNPNRDDFSALDLQGINAKYNCGGPAPTTVSPPAINCPALLIYGSTAWRVSGGTYFFTYYYVNSPNSCCDLCRSAGTRCAYWETLNYGSGRYRCRLFSYVYQVSYSSAYLVGRNPLLSDAQSNAGGDGQGGEAGIEIGEGGEPVEEKGAKKEMQKKGKGRSG